MKYFYLNDIVKQGWANYAQLNRCSAMSINVRFCRDCPNFEIYGIQPDAGVTRGWCRRMSFWDTIEGEIPHYVRVNDSSFCNEDEIHDDDDC